VPEHCVVDAEGAFDVGHARPVELEVEEHVVPVAEVLDLVRQTPLAPRRRLDDLATEVFDHRLNVLRGRTKRVLIQFRPDDVHEFVVALHGAYLLSRGLAASEFTALFSGGGVVGCRKAID